MGHQVGGKHVGGVHVGVLGHVVDEGAGAAADAPHGVDVTLRVQLDGLAVLGEVDGELRHPQDRVVDADQDVVDARRRRRTAPTAAR